MAGDGRKNKGQVAVFMIIVIVVIILAVAATMLIGEIGFQRVRMANVADSGLITGASGLARSMNQIAMISNGPSGLMTNYVTMQTILAVHVTNNCCGIPLIGWAYAGEPYVFPPIMLILYNNYQLTQQADKIAEESAKSLRSALYDYTLGGALIEEPIPFKESEVTRENGRITAIDYSQYLDRISDVENPDCANFNKEYHSLKTGTSDWYMNNLISYAFNKSPQGYRQKKGKINIGEPEISGYESYVRAELQSVPTHVDPIYQPMPMPYLVWKPIDCNPVTGPPKCMVFVSIMPNPWAWINRIDIGSESFGVKMSKRAPFATFPFFGREVTLSHKNRARITGSTWSGYDLRMEE